MHLSMGMATAFPETRKPVWQMNFISLSCDGDGPWQCAVATCTSLAGLEIKERSTAGHSPPW